jgi:DHA1 family inner membrane transport protein
MSGSIWAMSNRDQRSHAGVSVLLFSLMFAAQAGLIAISPVLADVAGEFRVSTAEAGQTRTIAGLVAAVAALMVSRASGRIALEKQLLAGTTILALGALTSAAAPSFTALALAQVLVGAGVGILTTAGTLAAAAWVTPERRSATLSWALIGQPAAWIVGLPLIGVLGGASWRFGWLVPALGAAIAAGLLLPRRFRAGGSAELATQEGLRHALADSRVSRWFTAEVLANSAWAGTLVFSGALFVESYATSSALAGVLLAVGAGTYVLGNMAFRRLVSHDASVLLSGLVLALAPITALFGAERSSLVLSTVLFSAAAFAAGARTFVSSSFALAAAPNLRPALVAMRTSSMQIGYFAGSFIAGSALTIGGYPALGVVVGALFLASAAVLSALPAAGRGVRAVVASSAGKWSFGFSVPSRWRKALSRCRSRRASSALSSPFSC